MPKKIMNGRTVTPILKSRSGPNSDALIARAVGVLQKGQAMPGELISNKKTGKRIRIHKSFLVRTMQLLFLATILLFLTRSTGR